MNSSRIMVWSKSSLPGAHSLKRDSAVCLIFSGSNNPLPCISIIFWICPGYRKVFSTILGMGSSSNDRSPSELKASNVPTPSNSICSISVMAGIVTIFPFTTKRAGRVYSSITSIGENTDLYHQGGWGF